MITREVGVFRAAIPDGGRLAGLDVGTKMIGIALCDVEWTVASAAETIARTRFAADKMRIETLLEKQSVIGIVVGLPLNLDGSDSSRTQSVRAFARNIEPLGLPVLLWDERWSTAAVTRTLLDADRSRKRRAELVDKLAAAYILQGAIDGLTMGGPLMEPMDE